jgi:hypothetical protein
MIINYKWIRFRFLWIIILYIIVLFIILWAKVKIIKSLICLVL